MSRETARDCLVTIPSEEVLGDAMLSITENQRGFVVAMLETGGSNPTRAAAMAGFGGTDMSTRQAAHRLMHNPAVLAAFREEADRRLRSGAILGASVMVEIASDAKHKDRFKAADRLLASAGLMVEQTHRVIHEDNRSDTEIERAVAIMAQKFGIDPKKLLGHSAPIEGEFEVVGDADGLEDIL